MRVIEKEPSVLYDFSSEKPRVSPDGWMETLRDATPRKGGTARCDPSARPGAGVRAVRQFWRRGDASSYERAAVDGVGETSSSGASHLADHPVLAALARRLRDGTVPGSRAASDTMKIGLAVEGGGMKGVVSAGACGELLRLGMYDCFDAVYGSSAGAMNLTYYLAKQPEGVKAYQEDLVDGTFLDLKRLPKTRRSRRLMGTSRGRAPAMDVSYLVDGVMDGATGRALRWSDVLASTVAFNVVATSLDTLTPVILHSPFKDVADLKQALKASAAVPLFAGPKPVRHRGQRLVDAAVMEPVPIHAAAADGCTHVLVLLTRVLDDSEQGDKARDGKKGTRRKRSRVLTRAFGPLAYAAVRGALMSPTYATRGAYATGRALWRGTAPPSRWMRRYFERHGSHTSPPSSRTRPRCSASRQIRGRRRKKSSRRCASIPRRSKRGTRRAPRRCSGRWGACGPTPARDRAPAGTGRRARARERRA